MMIRSLTTPDGLPVHYLGLGPEAGPLPAFFYFALSGEESLSLHPFNSPILKMGADPNLRVFSFTIPGHGLGFDKFHAMQYWADAIKNGEYLIEDFLECVTKGIQWLIDSRMVDPEHLAVGGLSRGGFIATHVAARDSRIRTLLGLAPLTTLEALTEFEGDVRFSSRLEPLSLMSCIETLTHLHHVRFYIGNHDTRVSTDACYAFIRKLSEKVHEKKARHCHVELFITHSIGHKGHGTDPSVFEEGGLWVKQHLLKKVC